MLSVDLLMMIHSIQSSKMVPVLFFSVNCTIEPVVERGFVMTKEKNYGSTRALHAYIIVTTRATSYNKTKISTQRWWINVVRLSQSLKHEVFIEV